MVNNRVLELLKNPKNIQSEDLHLLKEEINSFPYIQNIRALHLYGVNLFDKDNYQKELSVTAAYTTDKKILYQLINGKIEPAKAEKPVEKITESELETKDKPVQKFDDFTASKEEKKASKHDYEAISGCLITPKPDIKHIIVNGERNRILFEGEENFLNENDSDKIDLESTMESGVIVMHKPAIAEENTESSDTEIKQAPSELIINEDKIDSEKVVEKVNNENELSFQKIESFKPETETPEESSNEIQILSETSEFESTESINLETIINEDKIDSEKVVEKVNDENELSFQKIESFKPETETPKEPSNEIELPSETSEFESTESVNLETIINEDNIDSKKVVEKVNDETELSFHGTDSFLPEVKIEAKKQEQNIQPQAAKTAVNKHEDEMRRLIEEVEKKMKAQKKETEPETDIQKEETGGEISFAETQDFIVGNPEKNESLKEDNPQNQENQKDFKEEIKEETEAVENEPEVNSGWKPMSFESHLPDSYGKKQEIQTETEKTQDVEIPENNDSETTEKVSETEEATALNQNTEAENTSKTKNDEVPVMNVSFFGTDILSLPVKNEVKSEPKPEEVNKKPQDQQVLDSNIPGFINTWQSWLKIDRTEDAGKSKIETKNKVIESFIENNPKISQLKDDINFVVKEKTDDISHLMTETLANLYTEQKLYTKAVNAFQVLIKKHPERKEYFENKIKEIKDNRGKN